MQGAILLPIQAAALVSDSSPATEQDFSTEYLDSIITVAVVDGVSAAIDHISRYGSDHTEAIITEDEVAASRFLEESIRQLSWSMLPPSLPMAASLVWGRKLAFRPAACMPAGPSAPPS